MRHRPTRALRSRCTPTFAVFLALAWAGGDAAAQEKAKGEESDRDAGGLDKARNELGELRYDDALATLGKALQAGTSGPAATAQIYLLLGEVRASLGQRGEAEKAFQQALAIDPGLALRKGLSPKIGRPFRKAQRARRFTRPIEIAHEIAAQNPPTVAVLILSDSLGMVAGARVIYWSERGAARSVAGTGKDRIEIALPRGVSRFAVAGIDRHGNRLVELGSEQQPLVIETAPPPVAAAGATEQAAPSTEAPAAAARPARAAPEPAIEQEHESASTPFYASWILWGGVAIGVGAVGAWAGLSANSALNDLDDIRETDYQFEYSEAQDVADRAQQRSLIANICFGAAGVSAIAATILYFHQHGGDGEGEEDIAVAPVVGGEQVGVAASLRF